MENPWSTGARDPSGPYVYLVHTSWRDSRTGESGGGDYVFPSYMEQGDLANLFTEWAAYAQSIGDESWNTITGRTDPAGANAAVAVNTLIQSVPNVTSEEINAVARDTIKATLGWEPTTDMIASAVAQASLPAIQAVAGTQQTTATVVQAPPPAETSPLSYLLMGYSALKMLGVIR